MTLAYLSAGLLWTITWLAILAVVANALLAYEVRCSQCGYGERWMFKPDADYGAARHRGACSQVPVRKRRTFERPGWAS